MWVIGLILHMIYFISPAYAANAFAVFGGGKPVDGGRSFRGRRLLGDGKTWKGLLYGSIAGTLFGLMWFFLSQSGPLSETYYGVFDFRITDPLFGLYLGFGALVGDILGSFLKRRMRIDRGRPLWGVDQLDLVFGGLLFAYFFYPDFIIWQEVLALIVLTPPLHMLGNQLAFHMKRKAVWW